MMRGKALVLTLIVAILAGPSLCCCDVVRIGSALRGNHQQASHHKHTCCPCCPEDEDPDAPPETPKTPHRCPCQQDESKHVAALPASADASVELARFGVLTQLDSQFACDFSCILIASEVPSVCSEWTTPSLHSQDPLRAYHILRC